MIETSKEYGLTINPQKCELYFPDDLVLQNSRQSFEHLAPDIRIMEKCDLELLGSPVFEVGIKNSADKKMQKINLMTNRLQDGI